MRALRQLSLLLALFCVAVCSAPLAFAFMAPSPSGVIINETFDDYEDQAAFETVWLPSPSPSPTSPPTFGGTLLPDGAGGLVPGSVPDSIEGKAVHIQSGLNSYAGGSLPELQSLYPTLWEPIRLSADIFVDLNRNKRVTVGLRHTLGPAGLTSPLNIIELGHWNANAIDPTTPDGEPPVSNYSQTGFAYRVMLFGALGGDLARQPNFQYFVLDDRLDRPDDGDALVTLADIGSGWHRYAATIGVDFVTLTLDLFRDGVNNASGLPGVDSEVTYHISPRDIPFNDLRFGGASGLTSQFGAVVDNIVLERVQTIPEPAALSLASVAVLASVRKLRRR